MAKEGLGKATVIDWFGDLDVDTFKYLYVGLPGLDGVKYMEGKNWLGVALSALMNLGAENTIEVGAKTLERLAEAPLNEQQRFLLAECVHHYLPMTKQQWQQFEKLTEEKQEYQGAKKMHQSILDWVREEEREKAEKVRQEEREKSLQDGAIMLVTEALIERFGSLPEGVSEQLKGLSHTELTKLVVKIGAASSLAELGLGQSEAKG